MSLNQKKTTIYKIISVILILLAVAGATGFIAMFTNGFTEEFKSFYIETNGEKLLQTETNRVFACGEEQRFDVKYTFSDLTKDKPSGYTVKVIPNEETDFDFTVDGEVYSYAAVTDLTAAFDIVKYDEYFTLTLSDGMSIQSVLGSLYPDKNVQVTTDVKDKYPYTLLISSYNGKVTYRINFNNYRSAEGITLDKGVMVF